MQNDEALDWMSDMADLGADGVIGSLEGALAPVVTGLPGSDGAERVGKMATAVLAASETVACALGEVAPYLRGELLAEVRKCGAGLEARAGVADLAERALDAVLTDDAPLVALWREGSAASAEWDSTIATLRGRLAAARARFPGTWRLANGGMPNGRYRAVMPLSAIDLDTGSVKSPSTHIGYVMGRFEVLEGALGLPDGLADGVTYDDDGLEGLAAFIRQTDQRFERIEEAWGLVPLPRRAVDAASVASGAVPELVEHDRARFARLIAHVGATLARLEGRARE